MKKGLLSLLCLLSLTAYADYSCSLMLKNKNAELIAAKEIQERDGMVTVDGALGANFYKESKDVVYGFGAYINGSEGYQSVTFAFYKDSKFDSDGYAEERVSLDVVEMDGNDHYSFVLDNKYFVNIICSTEPLEN